MSFIKNPMHQWFMYLFEQRMDKKGYVKCFECKRKLHQDIYKKLSICYSHILPKKIYKEYAGREENIFITCPDCHTLYTIKPKQAINQYNKYLKLKEKYHEEKHGLR